MASEAQQPETEELRMLSELCERGRRFEEGNGVEQNAGYALRCYREAAEAGFAEAQWRLGTCYQEGIGVAEDEPEGCLWFTKAAEQGHSGAQFDLALCYDVGTGVPEDAHLAFRWYRAAAEQGHAEAQYYLAECYEYGLGTEVDLDAAWLWYNRSAEQGYAEAIEAVEAHLPVEPEVEPVLPPDGLTGLQRLREAHHLGNRVGLLGIPVTGVVTGICTYIHQGSVAVAFSLFGAGLALGYFVGYIPGMFIGYFRAKAYK